MGRPALIVLAVLAALLGTGCAGRGPAEAGDPGDARPVVLTSFTVLADIAGRIAGPHLAVESITRPGAEVHGYQPTPGDLRAAARADLVVENGLNLEAWFAQFYDRLDVPRVVVSDGVEPVGIQPAGGPSVGTESAPGTAPPNPHAWMSPRNVEVYADNLAQAFAALDPAHAADFRANAAAYRTELRAVHDDLVGRLQGLAPARRALVTCEGAFSYLARDAGLTERYIWPVNAERQATPRRVAATIEFVRSHRVPAVFCESTVSDAPMQRVVESTDARFGGVLFVDSLSGPDGPVPTYLDLIRHTTATIAGALTDPAAP